MNAIDQRSACEDDATILRRLAVLDNRDEAVSKVAQYTEDRRKELGRGLNLENADLRGLDLSGFDLRGATLNRANLNDTNLTGANLRNASIVCPAMERTKLINVSFRGAYIHALAAQAAVLDGADFTNIPDGTGALFHGCSMRNVIAANAGLAGTTFYQCDLTGGDFAKANLQGAVMNECILDNVRFPAALVSNLTITKCRMHSTSFERASGRGLNIQGATCCDGLNLAYANLPVVRCDGITGSGIAGCSLVAPQGDFQNCIFHQVTLSGSDLRGSRWSNCTLYRTAFGDALLEGALLTRCEMHGAGLGNVRAENAHFIECNLEGAEMRGFNARAAVFRNCNMKGADLGDAYLYRTVMTGDPPRAMNLRRANFENSVLTQSCLCADLEGARLRGANAAYARFNQCLLTGADMAGVNLFQASLVKADLTSVDLSGVAPPVFVSRCRGLQETLKRRGDKIGRLNDFVSKLEDLLASSRQGST